MSVSLSVPVVINPETDGGLSADGQRIESVHPYSVRRPDNGHG